MALTNEQKAEMIRAVSTITAAHEIVYYMTSAQCDLRTKVCADCDAAMKDAIKKLEEIVFTDEDFYAALDDGFDLYRPMCHLAIYRHDFTSDIVLRACDVYDRYFNDLRARWAGVPGESDVD